MRAFALGFSFLFVLAGGSVYGQDDPLIRTGSQHFRPYQYPNCPPGTYPLNPSDPSMPIDPKAPFDPKMPPDPKNPLTANPDLFAGATEAGTQPGAMFNANMFGDLIGISGQRLVQGRQGSTPVALRGVTIPGRYNGFKITDNESPRPIDRVYFSYNNFSNVNRTLLGPGAPSISMNQELLGFEKTFLNGDASFGMRLPFVQQSGFNGVDSNVVGDLSFLFKFAWINNRDTGNIFSTGLVVTAPTGGGNSILPDGTAAPHSTLFQPWAGFIYNLPNWYVQGFSSLVVPTDSRDPTIFFNSLSFGYWLYRNSGDRLLTGFVPVLEFHSNTPLNHNNQNDMIFFQEQLNITTGAYVLFPRMTLGAAVCVPVVSPRPYDIEAIVTLNFRF